MIPVLFVSGGSIAMGSQNVQKQQTYSFKSEKLDAHTTIDRHLNAYVNNDYETFKALFHPDIEVYDFPNKLIFKGMADFDKTYKILVGKINKSAFISKRIIEGKFVVDMETVKVHIPGRDEQVIEGLVIYQLKDNLIYRMMFLKDN
jgi:hypothetical protein